MSAPDSLANFQVALSLMNHTYFNPIIGALVRHGVPDHLGDGPLAAAELAQRARVNALALTRVLRALAAFGTFQEVSAGVFANNGVSSLFRQRPGGLCNYALYNSSDHHVRSAAALGHSVVTGESATQQVFGESFWEYARRHPQENETFNRALAELRGEEHQQIADAYDWSAVHTVVDVGGGIGSLLAAIMGSRSGIRGVLLEQPELLAEADRVLSERGVRQRCELLAGDFFDPISASGEAWTLCQVLHDWSDADCLTILRRCRDAMRPTDHLLVIEMLTIPCEPNMHIGLIDMVMLMYFGEARQRTVAEYQQLLEPTRFSLTRVLPTAGAFSIVEASPR
ncbi:MAG TPA: methyltransferase [Steroidobacteraceae bacterium]|nr:methyltransferase [Steroidobacteraceae bacterium]